MVVPETGGKEKEEDSEIYSHLNDTDDAREVSGAQRKDQITGRLLRP